MSTVLITGGTRGIGAATARLFKQNGHNVAICYKYSDELANKLADEGIFAYKCDVANSCEIDKMLEKIHSELGKIDVLINNAAIALKQKPFFDVEDKELEQIFAVNVFGAYSVTKKVVFDMIEKKSGSIVNVSSIWGLYGGSCECAYSMTKGALISFTKSLYKELSSANIRVNCVAPGFVDTEMNKHLTKEEMREFLSGYAVDRACRADEVAQTIYFLAGDLSSYINGEVICMDGGKL